MGGQHHPLLSSESAKERLDSEIGAVAVDTDGQDDGGVHADGAVAPGSGDADDEESIASTVSRGSESGRSSEGSAHPAEKDQEEEARADAPAHEAVSKDSAAAIDDDSLGGASTPIDPAKGMLARASRPVDEHVGSSAAAT